MENSQYFEGVLQLRNCTEEVYDFIANRMKEEGVKIAKEVNYKEGVDLYVSSNKFLKKIAKMLKEKFPGVVKQTSKLFTRDKMTSKNVYRGTVLFRMPDFKKGDAGIFRGDEVKIVSIGEKVNMQNTKSGKRIIQDFDEVNKHFKPIPQE